MKKIICVLILMLLIGLSLSGCKVQKTGDAAPKCRFDSDCKEYPGYKCDYFGNVEKYVCYGRRCRWRDYIDCDYGKEDCEEDCQGARCVTKDGTCKWSYECKGLKIDKCKDNSVQIKVCSMPSPEPTWPPTPIIGTCEYISIKNCTEFGQEQDPPVDLICKVIDFKGCKIAGCALPSPIPEPSSEPSSIPSSWPISLPA